MDNVLLRHIDDGLLLWRVDTSEPSFCMDFEEFITEINVCNNLKWTVSEISTIVNFLDINLTVTSNHELIVKPCAKPFHLHQFIPYHSAHPPGITKATIKGILLIYWLHCTFKSIYREFANHFYKKFIESNHKLTIIKECFKDAAAFIQEKV